MHAPVSQAVWDERAAKVKIVWLEPVTRASRACVRPTSPRVLIMSDVGENPTPVAPSALITTAEVTA
jgi:hypothetical protein